MKINGTHHRTIWPDPANKEEICILDQRLLPHRIVIEKLRDPEDAITAISDMYVRGAGLIGATAGFGMYLAALKAPESGFSSFMNQYSDALGNSRPTARNLKWAIERVNREIDKVQTVGEKREKAFATGCEIADEDALFCRKIGEHGVALIAEISRRKNGEPVNILTHCNAGWLAFVDYGSATAPIYAARDAGIDIHVWVDETRPWNQGARLTAWELQQEGIPNTLICDNTGGHLMQHGLVDMVLVGSDRTTHTGDVANKIGTYLKAVAARDNGIPFYAALPSSTFDWNIDNGFDIPIEQRSENEVTQVMGLDATGAMSNVTLCAPGTKAANYGFDITPSRLVSGLITERGVVDANRDAIHKLYPEGAGTGKSEFQA
ncbi:S-methyl-5-thioribose-1-phosphate isomerase [Desulforhopalus singaporensis]|uniref:Methylthioribose-1-phosphate isomerase n=1 Tax=Desulforhopalus singaporensis TaxID=91360 RepID=A0A1H0JLU6_9BACT|nr:S-methyl-5-thioribose-1-phosphate isomerase [Desulforhopalus singaporensis]SDO44594.1 methylthioribose-1-phosphate isomerase [Desulforhopalus singaporensis]